MFDRKTYQKNYYRERRIRYKRENRCTACGDNLAVNQIGLKCEKCRQRQIKNNRRHLEKQKRNIFVYLGWTRQ